MFSKNETPPAETIFRLAPPMFEDAFLQLTAAAKLAGAVLVVIASGGTGTTPIRFGVVKGRLTINSQELSASLLYAMKKETKLGTSPDCVLPLAAVDWHRAWVMLENAFYDLSKATERNLAVTMVVLFRRGERTVQIAASNGRLTDNQQEIQSLVHQIQGDIVFQIRRDMLGDTMLMH
jgi:hypothetical protein